MAYAKDARLLIGFDLDGNGELSESEIAGVNPQKFRIVDDYAYAAAIENLQGIYGTG